MDRFELGGAAHGVNVFLNDLVDCEIVLRVNGQDPEYWQG
jgi:hypothetical protein